MSKKKKNEKRAKRTAEKPIIVIRVRKRKEKQRKPKAEVTKIEANEEHGKGKMAKPKKKLKETPILLGRDLYKHRTQSRREHEKKAKERKERNAKYAHDSDRWIWRRRSKIMKQQDQGDWAVVQCPVQLPNRKGCLVDPNATNRINFTVIKAAFRIDEHEICDTIFGSYSLTTISLALLKRLDQILHCEKTRYHHHLIDSAKIVARQLKITGILDFFAVIGLVSMAADGKSWRFRDLQAPSSMMKQRFLEHLDSDLRSLKDLTKDGLKFRSALEAIHHFRKHRDELGATLEDYCQRIPKQLFQPENLVKTLPNGRLDNGRIERIYRKDRLFGVLQVDPITNQERILTIHCKSANYF